MEEIIKKLENYNIFNYLLPGIVFNVCCKYYIGFELVKNNNLLVSIFAYYFVGLVISRFASLVIKPLLWKFKILKEKDSSKVKDFYKAEKEDAKIKTLFIDYNMYRNFIATFALLLLLKPIYELKIWLNINSTICFTVLLISLLILFTLAYKKQLGYMHSRIENNSAKK